MGSEQVSAVQAETLVCGVVMVEGDFQALSFDVCTLAPGVSAVDLVRKSRMS